MPAVPAERLRNRKKRKANPKASSKASSKVNSKVSFKVSSKVDSKVISTDVENTQPPTPTRNLLIKRHSKQARIPTRGSALAAGYDLYSAEKKLIPARGKAVIDTQISIVVPPGTYGRVAPRSGLASKFSIDTGAGVIDADYRGILHILLFNLGDDDFEVAEGDRIAQLIVERIYTPDVREVEDLDETARGSNGFGSTGGHNAL